MTTNTAVYTGLWGTNANWSLGHAPLVTEDAVIPLNIYITTNGTPTCRSWEIQTGGALFMAAGITMTVGVYGKVAGGSLISQGLSGTPAIIDAVDPAAQWFLMISPQSANNVLDFLWLKNNKYYLGNETVGIFFNDKSNSTGSWINNVTPLTRAPIIINHAIDGRAYGRTYRRGSQAGVVTVSGHFYFSNWEHQNIRNLQALNTAVCLTTERIHLARASIDGEPPDPRFMKFVK